MPKLIVDNDIQTENMSDEFMITKEFKNSAEFSQYIEKVGVHTDSYIDAIVDYCTKRGIEIETIKKLLSPSLKDKIKVEAENLNLIKGSNGGGKLPI